MNKGKFILLVIDGLGVGAMPDVVKTRPEDVNAHTLKHVIESTQVSLPFFEKIGAIDFFVRKNKNFRKLKNLNISFGKFKLAHYGADSYMGHQEIAGSKIKKPIRQFVREVYKDIIDALKKEGFTAWFNSKFIEVKNCIAIADNVETDYGLNINVVGSLDYCDFETIAKVGLTVRKVVKVGRVITMGGVNINKQNFFQCFDIREKDGYVAWGIDIPKLNIYNEKYRVIHLGYGISYKKQAPAILTKEKITVVLIGKAADVIQAPGARYLPQVKTKKVLDYVLMEMKKITKGLIFANVQEADLAGHRKEAKKYASILKVVDSYLPKLIAETNNSDILLICGDHGNDPLGTTLHSREYTPLIVMGKGIKSLDLGIRNTLADIGATICDYFDLQFPEVGESFLKKIA